jgi:hypothetical protein
LVIPIFENISVIDMSCFTTSQDIADAIVTTNTTAITRTTLFLDMFQGYFHEVACTTRFISVVLPPPKSMGRRLYL